MNKTKIKTKEPQTELEDSMPPLQGNILIVDDEGPLRRVLIRTLSLFGLNSEEAENGIIALNKLKESKFDVVITDLKMPEMSGEELICQMDKLGILHDTKVLIVSGGITSDEALKEKSVLISGIICKPFDINEIYDILKKVLKV